MQQTHLLEMVATGRPLAACLEAICDAVPDLSADMRACILLAGASRAHFESCIANRIPGSFGARIEGAPIGALVGGACAQALERGTPIICPDIANAPEWPAPWRENCLEHGILACHLEPILGADGIAVGAFMSCLGRPRAPRAHEHRLAQFGARIASIALERDRATAALLASEARLREADRRKDEFLATLAHELRNPLAPLSNALQLIDATALDDTARRRLHGMMRRQVHHLVRLVDDLLEAARITRGVLELRKQRIPAADIVKHAVESVEPLIQGAHHRLAVTMPEEPLWVEGDPVRLAQILGNVLNNAAKYTPAGGAIDVRVEGEVNSVRISVRDNGPGIDADAVPRIFEMFRRTEAAMSGVPTGLGIGLALARRLAEMHGGSLEAHSDGPGRGAEFVMLLPLAPERESSAAGATVSAAALRSRVLIVDDNVDAAQSLAMLLAGSGAQVHVAHDGHEALRAFALHRPAAVLLDIGMPDIDGYEVARRLRAQFPDHRSLLIALTGWGQREDRRRAQEAGFDHHLVKPADLDALRALLDPEGGSAPALEGSRSS